MASIATSLGDRSQPVGLNRLTWEYVIAGSSLRWTGAIARHDVDRVSDTVEK
jgi:hypothetical protein